MYKMAKFEIKIYLKNLPSVYYMYKSSPFQIDSKFLKPLVKIHLIKVYHHLIQHLVISIPAHTSMHAGCI